MAGLADAPIPGYDVVDLTWQVEVFPGHFENLTGTAEQVHHAARAMNPGWKPNLAKRVPLFNWSKVICGAGERGWHPCKVRRIEEGIEYLRGLAGVPRNGPGPETCGRVSCSYQAAIWWCNNVSLCAESAKYTWRARLADCRGNGRVGAFCAGARQLGRHRGQRAAAGVEVRDGARLRGQVHDGAGVFYRELGRHYSPGRVLRIEMRGDGGIRHGAGASPVGEVTTKMHRGRRLNTREIEKVRCRLSMKELCIWNNTSTLERRAQPRRITHKGRRVPRIQIALTSPHSIKPQPFRAASHSLDSSISIRSSMWRSPHPRLMQADGPLVIGASWPFDSEVIEMRSPWVATARRFKRRETQADPCATRRLIKTCSFKKYRLIQKKYIIMALPRVPAGLLRNHIRPAASRAISPRVTAAQLRHKITAKDGDLGGPGGGQQPPPPNPGGPEAVKRNW